MSKKQQTLSNFSGIPPPQKKRQLERREFSQKWLQEVPWLESDGERRQMWCKICHSHPHLADKTSAFYAGTKNFSHPVFDKHEMSKDNTNVVQAIKNTS